MRGLEVEYNSKIIELSSAEEKYQKMIIDPCENLGGVIVIGDPILGQGCIDEMQIKINQGETCWRIPLALNYDCQQRELQKVEKSKKEVELKNNQLIKSEKDLERAVKSLLNDIELLKSKMNTELVKRYQYTKEIEFIEARRDLEVIKEKERSLSGDIKSLNSKKDIEIAKRNQYIKEKQDIEVKIQRVLNTKSYLESEISKEKVDYDRINKELVVLLTSDKAIDSSNEISQKQELEKRMQGLEMTIYSVIKYQSTEMLQEQIQHENQDL